VRWDKIKTAPMTRGRELKIAPIGACYGYFFFFGAAFFFAGAFFLVAFFID
jgi:hypothetical protein